MEYAAVAISALAVAVLSLYSGFGLGTLLMPVFAIFFPVPVAIAATAVVHLANNVFKVGLVGRDANWRTVLAFGIPATAFALLGAFLLVRTSQLGAVAVYHIGSREFSITVIKLLIALLIVGFTLFEVLPFLRRLEFHQRFVLVGGALSGFFGGLSGHQGALRSAVLTRIGLSTASFIGTVSVCALMVDIARLAIYGTSYITRDFSRAAEGRGLILVSVVIEAAFLGTFLGSRFLQKVAMESVRRLVGILLVVLAVALAFGLV